MESHTREEAQLEIYSANDTWEKKLQDPSATPLALPLEFLKAVTCDFSAERELGSGGYGVVYKGVLSTGKIIAVKKLFDLHKLGDEKFLMEVNSLMGVKHQNVVQFVGYCAESSFEAIDPHGSRKYILAEIPKRLLCFEHVCNNSLDKYISDESSGLQWNMRYEIIRGICGGLHYLHEKCHIVHLDLKPENILMDATMMPKIADFGLSRIFGVQQSRIITQNRPGTLGYMAQEYILQGIVSIKADIYSLGVIIIEILTGSRYYPLSKDNSLQSTETSFRNFKDKILEIWRNRLQRSQGDTIQLGQIQVCAELGIQCIAFNPDQRPVTKHMLGRLDDVKIMDGSIKIGTSCTSAVAQTSRGREEGCEGNRAKLTDICGETGAAEIKSENHLNCKSIHMARCRADPCGGYDVRPAGPCRGHSCCDHRKPECGSCRGHCCGSSRARESAQPPVAAKKAKRCAPQPRHHCRPVLKGAPFIVCSNCLTLIQVPAGFAVASPRVRDLRCGACSAVLSYTYLGPDDAAPAGPCRGHSCCDHRKPECGSCRGHCCGLSRARESAQPPVAAKKAKRCAPQPRHHCRPVLKGAPFIVCSKCLTLVQVPAGFAVASPRVRDLRCGACSAVLSYTYLGPDDAAPNGLSLLQDYLILGTS